MEFFFVVAVTILYNRDPVLTPVIHGEKFASREECESTLIKYLLSDSGKAERIQNELVVINNGKNHSTTYSCLRIPMK